MLNPSLDGSLPIEWLTLLYQAAPSGESEREDGATSVLRDLNEALIEDDRAETLAQFDPAIILLARYKRWRSGMHVTRRVYAAVRAWQDFDSSAYARTLARFTFNYALEFQQAHVLRPAEKLLLEAFRLFEECGDEVGAIASEHQLGRVLQERGEMGRSEKCYLSSLQRARLFDDRNHICRNLFQLGQLAQLQGDLDTSVGWYNQTLTLAEEMDDGLLATAALHQLGMVEQMRGDYAVAGDRFHAALARAQKINDARGVADAMHQLGMLAQAQSELSRAEEWYNASLTHAAMLADPAEQAPTLYQLAQCAWIRGEYPAAKNYGQQSMSLVQAQGNLAGLRRVRRLLSSIQRPVID